mmetsp:Transcript_108228/g.306022  ORF Transcript_108228/g.306022 Transcript_108228/m.306022 type:complete len:529 (+) Transcript_108228:84-1670(+)
MLEAAGVASPVAVQSEAQQAGVEETPLFDFFSNSEQDAPVQDSHLFDFTSPAAEAQGQDSQQRGVLVHIAGGGGYGFIKPDNGDVDIFTLPPVKGFPPIGSRVRYNLVLDPKNGKYRADSLSPEDAVDGQDSFSTSSFSGGFGGGTAVHQHGDPQNSPAYQLAQSGTPGSGTLLHVAEDGRFGFIKPDAGGADILALPPPVTGFPRAGTRVTFNVLIDEKNGKLKADNILPENPADQVMMSQPPAQSQDLDLASSLLALGNAGQALQGLQGLTDLLQGLQALQGLQGLAGLGQQQPAPQQPLAGLEGIPGLEGLGALASLIPGLSALQGLQGGGEAPLAPGDQHYGTMRHIQGNGRFGFIKPDSGGADVLALPPPDGFPRVGSRVTYTMMVDDKTGRPKADNVMATSNAGGVAATAPQRYGQAGIGGVSAVRSAPYPTNPGWPSEINLQQQATALAPGEVLLGTVSKANEKFAFIKQDNGEADMFVIPPACEAFGRELPPVGARVQYRVVVDSKTGRPRADRVQPAVF